MTARQGSFDAMLSETGPEATPPAPLVEIRRTARRRKTASGHWEGDVIVIMAPERWPRSTREDVADRLVARMLKSRPGAAASDALLERRGAELSDLYLGGLRPSSIRWSQDQTTLWGSCTVATRAIRISTRLRPVPGWVLDSVILHELAHLVHDNHSPAFRALVEQLPRAKEADAFLQGLALGLSDASQSPAPGDCATR